MHKTHLKSVFIEYFHEYYNKGIKLCYSAMYMHHDIIFVYYFIVCGCFGIIKGCVHLFMKVKPF